MREIIQTILLPSVMKISHFPHLQIRMGDGWVVRWSWVTAGQGLTVLAVGAGGGCLDIFTLIYLYSPFSPSLWETARYGLKYCLKGSLNLKQPANQYIRMCLSNAVSK